MLWPLFGALCYSVGSLLTVFCFNSSTPLFKSWKIIKSFSKSLKVFESKQRKKSNKPYNDNFLSLTSLQIRIKN